MKIITPSTKEDVSRIISLLSFLLTCTVKVKTPLIITFFTTYILKGKKNNL